VNSVTGLLTKSVKIEISLFAKEELFVAALPDSVKTPLCLEKAQESLIGEAP